MASLPMKAMSLGAAPVTYGMDPYKWAKYTARINKKLTPDMLRNFCGFSDDAATRMIRRLTAENVLMAPDASGLSRTHMDYITRFKQKRQTLRDVIDKIDEIVPDEDVEHVEPEA